MSINDINESAVICRFNFYLNKTAKIQETFEATLHDAINEEEELCGEELAYIIEAILIPEIAIQSAQRFSDLDERFEYCSEEDDSLNSVFEIFVSFQGIDQGLANAIAETINQAAQKTMKTRKMIMKSTTRRTISRVFGLRSERRTASAEDLKPD